ncbi:MAG: SDR family NAD(P)-dependent oxidoreductase [Pseudomonadales bacterium]|nr:SDR family NAD(P)-dependent oxidoreductase [Pseudomonadales bacterium]
MFHGKRVLITGGSSGLGWAFAQAMAEQGAKLILIARRLQPLEQCRDDLLKHHPDRRISIHSIDVACNEAVQNLALQLAPEGDIDLLINCAGILREGRVELLETLDFEEQMAINYFGCIHTIRAFLPALQRTQGRIINISSLSGITGIFGYSGYCASKFAVQGLSEVLRLELKSYGIDVHVVCPGEFTSPMLTALQQHRSWENKAQTSTLPTITPEQVVQDTLRGIDRGDFEIIPGKIARVVRTALRYFPKLSRRFNDRVVARARFH